MVVTVDEELKISSEGLHSAGEASRFANQALQIMTKVCVDSFNWIGFLLIRTHFVWSAVIVFVIARNRIRVILLGLVSYCTPV